VEEWLACDSPPLSSGMCFTDFERWDGYVFPHFDIAPRDGALTDFSFVNIIEHKAEEIIGLYGVREHNFKC
jgi:hypothetical protein